MPPLISTMEALPIRIEQPAKTTDPSSARPDNLEEGEVDEQRLLVGHSSSPPPLIEDRSGLLDEGSDDAALPQAKMQSMRSKYCLLSLDHFTDK